MKENENLMTFKQAMDYLQVCNSKLRRMVYNREVPFYKIGKLIRFKKNSLDEWLEEQKIEMVSF